MKLTTILALPAATLGEKVRRLGDWAAQKAVALIPTRVRYWSTMSHLADTTMDSRDVPATPLDAILKRLPGGPR